MRALAATILLASGPAWAGDHCDWGDVQATFQALPVGHHIVNDQGRAIKASGLGGGVAECQLRVFLEVSPYTGEAWTFCEHDLILGGVVWLFPYPLDGWTLAEAKADMSLGEEHFFVGPAGGPLVEQVAHTTAFKHFDHPSWGLTLYRQHGFFGQFAPGNYESLWVSYWDGELMEEVAVPFTVLPHEDAH